jgi:hypothetical protein
VFRRCNLHCSSHEVCCHTSPRFPLHTLYFATYLAVYKSPHEPTTISLTCPLFLPAFTKHVLDKLPSIKFYKQQFGHRVVVIRGERERVGGHTYMANLQKCKRASNNLPFYFLAQETPVGQGPLIHEVSRSHTTVGRTPLDSDQFVAETITTQHSRQTSMPQVGFEPKISAAERPQTYALDRAAIRTGSITPNIAEL